MNLNQVDLTTIPNISLFYHLALIYLTYKYYIEYEPASTNFNFWARSYVYLHSISLLCLFYNICFNLKYKKKKKLKYYLLNKSLI